MVGSRLAGACVFVVNTCGDCYIIQFFVLF